MTNKPVSEIFNFSGKVLFEIPNSDVKVVHLNDANNTLGTHIVLPEELGNSIPIGTEVSGTVQVTYGQGLFEDDTIEVKTIETLDSL